MQHERKARLGLGQLVGVVCDKELGFVCFVALAWRSD
jgi:hypothetical protein